jgi:hypothetical protein
VHRSLDLLKAAPSDHGLQESGGVRDSRLLAGAASVNVPAKTLNGDDADILRESLPAILDPMHGTFALL